jgi:hypothetical protein
VSTRQLLAAAGVLVAVLGAFWYTVLAPKGNEVSSGAPVQVVLSATATGSGAWQRYLLTVKNVADGDFNGEALLIDAQDAAQSGSQPTQIPNKVPNLNTASRLPVAEVAGQSAYQVHVMVPSRTSRTVTIIAPDHFNYAQVRIGDQVMADAVVDQTPYISVAVLSDVENAAGAITQLKFDRFVPRVAHLVSAAQFPSSATLLAGYAAVVINQFDTQTLSGAQLQALRDFVGLGGTLVVTGGSGWRQSLAPLPPDLVPIRPTSTASLSLAPLAQLAGSSAADLEAPAAVGTLAKGARILVAEADGAPLAAKLTYGSGEVVQLAYDPGADPVRNTLYATLAWIQALSRGFGELSANGVTGSWLPVPESSFTALLPTADDAPLPSPVLFGALLVLYLLAVGPLNYLVVRRRLGRPTLFWFSAPLVSVVFAGLFYMSGNVVQGTLQDHEVQVIKVGTGNTVSLLEYHRILFLRRGNHEIAPQQNSLVSPLTLDTFRVTGSTCERCTSQLQALPSGAERVLPGPAPLVEESGVVYGSVRVVSSLTTAHLQAGLEAHLHVVGGHVRGTVANLGAQPAGELELFTYDGQNYHMARLSHFLGSGGAASVDSALGPAATDSSQAAQVPGSVGSLLQAVAVSELQDQGDAVLVGLTIPVSSHLTVDGGRLTPLAVAVLQQPVSMEAADSSLRDFETKRLTSSIGDSSKGFIDVYDLTIPPTTAALQLNMGQESVTSMEVYDWTQGTFVPVSTDSPTSMSTSPLTAGEIQDGMVRLRVHEPRLMWAQAIWVDSQP